MVFVTQPLVSGLLVSVLVLPTLLQGIIEKTDKLRNGGEISRIDPFVEIYGGLFLWCFYRS